MSYAFETAMIHIEEKLMRGDVVEYQLVFSVGVQHFDVGPRYDKMSEAEWFMHQFRTALDKFVEISTGVTMTIFWTQDGM